jgi:hypothetical protein
MPIGGLNGIIAHLHYLLSSSRLNMSAPRDVAGQKRAMTPVLYHHLRDFADENAIFDGEGHGLG